jgi:prepilin-type N-terminal cleavage/methylation domain-containing protein
MNKRRHNLALGFTLVEIMIAIGIFSMVMAGIYGTWSAVLRGSKAGLNAAAEAQRTRIAISSIEAALAGCEMFEANSRYYAFIADTSTDFAYLSLASRLPASFPGAGLFGDQTLRRVTFTVESGPNSRNDLVMYQVPLLAVTNATRRAIPITLARNVTLFGLEFWDARRAEWAQEWLATNQLPPMVRVSLAFGRTPNSFTAASEEVATCVVLLPPGAVPRQVQVPGSAGPVVRGGIGRTGDVQPPSGPEAQRGGSGITVPGGRGTPPVQGPPVRRRGPP